MKVKIVKKLLNWHSYSGKSFLFLLLVLIFACNIFPQHYGATGIVVKERPIKIIEKIDTSILVEGELYSKEYLNKHYIVLEEKQYSFGLDYLIKHKTKMKIYAVRKDTGATKYRLLQTWEVAKGRYIKSMVLIGYFLDLETGEYKTFDDIINGF